MTNKCSYIHIPDKEIIFDIIEWPHPLNALRSRDPFIHFKAQAKGKGKSMRCLWDALGAFNSEPINVYPYSEVYIPSKSLIITSFYIDYIKKQTTLYARYTPPGVDDHLNRKIVPSVKWPIAFEFSNKTRWML